MKRINFRRGYNIRSVENKEPVRGVMKWNSLEGTVIIQKTKEAVQTMRKCAFNSHGREIICEKMIFP